MWDRIRDQWSQIQWGRWVGFETGGSCAYKSTGLAADYDTSLLSKLALIQEAVVNINCTICVALIRCCRVWSRSDRERSNNQDATEWSGQGDAFYLRDLVFGHFNAVFDVWLTAAAEVNAISWLKKKRSSGWLEFWELRTVVCDWRFDNLCGSHFQSQVTVLASPKFKSPVERFGWSIDRVVVGKCVIDYEDVCRDWTNTNEQLKRPQQQQHRRTPLKIKPHYQLGLCYVFNLHYRLLSTNYTPKLVY